jgi:5-formaminoimidazole-4-carboxamide-1-(beta)-D-ribofuranosyl 5'-monophosphate synthetase
MIEKDHKFTILEDYKKEQVTIGTLGSHSALNIFKGAKEEGFRTVCVCTKENEIIYRRFSLADEIIIVKDFGCLLDDSIQRRLRQLNTILIPHGSFNAYLNMDDILNKLYVPMFGNRKLLHWEIDRELQRTWLQRAGLKLPKRFKDANEIDVLTIAKFPGAKGGKGYFLVNSAESFYTKAEEMIKRGHLTREEVENTYFQEYVVGVNVYPQYFHSLFKNEIELLGMDKRYESTVDSIGRIPASEQLQIGIIPTYTVVGNIPITVRERLLQHILRMADQVVKESKEIAPPGIIGPFCLETVITDNLEIFTFEISTRIVAGSNVGIGTSPYAYLMYGEGMYMGRRIAREIKNGIESDELDKIIL